MPIFVAYGPIIGSVAKYGQQPSEPFFTRWLNVLPLEAAFLHLLPSPLKWVPYDRHPPAAARASVDFWVLAFGWAVAFLFAAMQQTQICIRDFGGQSFQQWSLLWLSADLWCRLLLCKTTVAIIRFYDVDIAPPPPQPFSVDGEGEKLGEEAGGVGGWCWGNREVAKLGACTICCWCWCTLLLLVHTAAGSSAHRTGSTDQLSSSHPPRLTCPEVPTCLLATIFFPQLPSLWNQIQGRTTNCTRTKSRRWSQCSQSRALQQAPSEGLLPVARLNFTWRQAQLYTGRKPPPNGMDLPHFLNTQTTLLASITINRDFGTHQVRLSGFDVNVDIKIVLLANI